MLVDPRCGSKVWEAPDRAISESGKFRRQVVANGDSDPSAASAIDRIAATLGPACGLPMWIQLFIGFSAHSVEVALAAMDRYPFDTILFPINFVRYSQAKFGPQVLGKARQKEMGIMALKGMAKTTWSDTSKNDHPHPKCWYEPAAFPEEAAMGLRWTLSQPITAAIPPGDERYFRLGMDVGQNFQPITEPEQQRLMAGATGVNPIFHLGAA